MRHSPYHIIYMQRNTIRILLCLSLNGHYISIIFYICLCLCSTHISTFMKSAGCSGLKRILMLVLAIQHNHCQIREINLLRAKF